MSRCCGSVAFWYGSGSAVPYLDSDFPSFFVNLLFEATYGIHHFFKDKKSQRSHKTVGIKVFLTIFA
jgi:hypothetical protein